VLFLTLREMRAHARRLLGTGLAVVLGVAFLSGTLVLGATLRANFTDLLTEVNAGTDVTVRSATNVTGGRNGNDTGRGLIDASLVRRVAGVDGVAAAVPVVDGFGQLLGTDGKAIGGNGPPQLAGSWTTDPALNPYRLAEGRAPRGDGEVVVNRGAAAAGGLRLGSRTTLLTPEPVMVTIVGLATFGSADGLGGVTFTAMSLDDAQAHIAHSSAKVTSVAVRAGDGVDQAELADRIARVLPAGIEAAPGGQVTQEAIDDINATFLDLLTTLLTMFAGIALLVATFSIYNTFSIIVAQRTRQAALLRALGAGRGQVLRSVLAEAAAVGVLASALGLAAGVVVAGLLKGLFDAAGFALPAGGIVVTAGTVVASLVVGVLVTLVAGVAPAVRASRVAPLAALRSAAAERTTPSRLRIAAGAVIVAAGVAVTLAAALASSGPLAAAGAGAVLTVVGAVVLGPVAARPVAGAIGAPVARLRGITGALARENAIRNPRRTAATAAALMVGVAVVSLFTVFAASLKASLDDSIDRSFAGDLVVSSGRFGRGGISPALAGAVGGLPEVDTAVGLGQSAVLVDGSTKQVTVADPAALTRVVRLDVGSGDLAEAGRGTLAVAASTAEDHGWRVGSRVPVTYPDGTRQALTVAATYDRSDLVGGYLIPRSTWAGHGIQDADTQVVVSTSSGVPLAEAKAAVTRVADRFGGPDVLDRAEFASQVTGGVDMLLTIIYALLALAIVIALMGIANTLSLSVHERTRELGLLRAVGQTRRQVRSMVRWESVVVATFGAVGGLALGVFLGWALVRVAGAASDGLDVFALPAGRLALVLAVGAVAGVVAGIRPARRAARLDVLTAIATE
jgi:putative ABC transport system permease protein